MRASRTEALLSPTRRCATTAMTAMAGRVSPRDRGQPERGVARARTAGIGAQPDARRAAAAAPREPRSVPAGDGVLPARLNGRDHRRRALAMAADEHPVVRETAHCGAGGRPRRAVGRLVDAREDDRPRDRSASSTISSRRISRSSARAGTEAWFTAGRAALSRGRGQRRRVRVLDGEVSVLHGHRRGMPASSVEGPGSCIGELAVLDPGAARSDGRRVHRGGPDAAPDRRRRSDRRSVRAPACRRR